MTGALSMKQPNTESPNPTPEASGGTASGGGMDSTSRGQCATQPKKPSGMPIDTVRHEAMEQVVWYCGRVLGYDAAVRAERWFIDNWHRPDKWWRKRDALTIGGWLEEIGIERAPVRSAA